MNNEYVYLSADNVAHIKQNYYDEICNIRKLINDSERQVGIYKTSIIDIDEELKYINIVIKDTIFIIKDLEKNIDVESYVVYDLEKKVNSTHQSNNNKITILRNRIKELEGMKRNLIILKERKNALISRKKELICDKRNAKKNIKIINKNSKIYKGNIVSLNSSLILVDDAYLNSNSYVKEKSIKPKLKQARKLK